MQGLHPSQEAAAAPAAAVQVDSVQSAAPSAHTSNASRSSPPHHSTPESAGSPSQSAAAAAELGAGGKSAPLSHEPGCQAQQQQQDVSSLGVFPSPNLAVLFADMGLQQQLCVPQGVSISSTGPPGTSSSSFGPIATTATAPPSSFPCLAGMGYENGHAAEAAAAAAGSCPAASALSTAALAADAAVGGACGSCGLSRTSSSSSAAFQVTPAGSGPEQQQPQAVAVGLLSDLGVSMESLQRLLTADCVDDFEQPVWMVVNLQGKIKGSYTPEKMLEFFRRGTLSASQLLLGIDQNLPYSARQDLSFYRRLDSLVKCIHCGARYTPLTEAAATALKQQGLTGSHWQLLAPQHTTTQHGDGRTSPSTAWASLHSSGHSSSRLGQSGSDSSGGRAGGSRPGTPAAAAAQLRSALERLCGCSVTEAMAIDRAAARVPMAAAASTAAVGSQAAQAETQAAADVTSTPAEAAAEAAPLPSAAASDAASLSAGPAGSSAEGPSACPEASSSSSSDPKDPVWLYINHLGWCRGPFLGARIVQAHMCGRLPRDTLVAAHAPEVPSAVVSTDIAYFFRPLGVLLDNVGNGWTYNAITWSDVATRDLAATTMTAPLSAADGSWQPLKWEGPAPAPSLVNPDQLMPPQSIPTAATQPLPPGPGRGRARGATGSPGSSTGARYAGRRAQRAQLVMPLSWSSPQLQQQLPGFEYPPARLNPAAAAGSPALLAPGGSGLQFPAQMQPDRLMPLLSRSVPASPQQLYSPQVAQLQQQQQQQVSPTPVLLGHVQAQHNRAALPVYAPQQLALPSLQQQQLVQQEQQQQQQQQQILGLNRQNSSPACDMSALYSAAIPQQQGLLFHASSSSTTLNGLPLQQGQLLQQAHQAGLQLQQQQQMLLLQAQQQQHQQVQSVLQLQPLAQHTPLLQLQPHTQQQQQQQQGLESLSQLLQQQMQLQQQLLQVEQQPQQAHMSVLLPQGIDQQQAMMLPSDAQQQQQQQLLLSPAQFGQGYTEQQPGGQLMPFVQLQQQQPPP